MNTSKNSIEEMGWEGVRNLMDLLEDNLLKFADQTNVSPAEMYETIEGRLKQTMDKVWTIKGRKADVYMREMSRDVRLP